MFKNTANLIPILFIILFSVFFSGYVSDLMGCKIQNLLNSNIYIKYIIIFFIIYSTISVTNTDDSPTTHFKNSIYLLILFVIFTKNTFRITVIVIAGMFALFIVNDFLNHYKNKQNVENNKSNNNEKIVKYFENLKNIIQYSIIVLLIYGHIWYILKQKNKFGIKFDIFKLYKGSKCIII